MDPSEARGEDLGGHGSELWLGPVHCIPDRVIRNILVNLRVHKVVRVLPNVHLGTALRLCNCLLLAFHHGHVLLHIGAVA